jgi:hypothetical protein
MRATRGASAEDLAEGMDRKCGVGIGSSIDGMRHTQLQQARTAQTSKYTKAMGSHVLTE